jgi:hypothetical protein
MRENWKSSFAIVAVLLICWVGTARADVIDGNWCNHDGRHFSISGATIVTTRRHENRGELQPPRFFLHNPFAGPVGWRARLHVAGQ